MSDPTNQEGNDQPSSESNESNQTINELTLNDEVSSGEVALTVPTKPEDQLRMLTLVGLFGLIVLSLGVITPGLIWDWFGEDFAKTIIQTLISPVLGALTAIIGYLFAERKYGRS